MKQVIIAIVLILTCSAYVHCQCTITQGTQIGVNEGATPTLTATCGTGKTWTSSGQGSINSSSGVYTAPAHVVVQHTDRGCQVSPNNSVFNVPVNALPVDPHSAYWLTRAAEQGQCPGSGCEPVYHNLKVFASQPFTFFDNVVNNSTQTQTMHFAKYPSRATCQDCPFPWPTVRNAFLQGGMYYGASGPYITDIHFNTMNSQTCVQSEVYQPRADWQTFAFTAGNPVGVSWSTHNVWPIANGYQIYVSGATGAWAGLNNLSGSPWTITTTGQPGTTSGTINFNCSGCSPSPYSSPTVSSILGDGGTQCMNCNAGGGAFYTPYSYAMLVGENAAGIAENALSVNSEEWQQAVQKGAPDLGHAIAIAISTAAASARGTWPATGFANPGNGGPQNGILNAVTGTVTTFQVQSDISVSLPCDMYTYTDSCTFHINHINMTGPWAAANGDWVATRIDSYHYTIPLNSTSFPSFAGQPASYMYLDFMPYGTSLRLKASESFSSDFPACVTSPPAWCAYAQIYFNTLQKYGLIVVDTTAPGGNWYTSNTIGEYVTKDAVDAANKIRQALTGIESRIEVVNRTGQQVSGLSLTPTGWQATNVNPTTVTVTGSGGMATSYILLQGGTIGTDKEAILQASGSTYTLNVWENGNANPGLSFAIGAGITGASINSSTGAVTMPACTTTMQTVITVTDTNDTSITPLPIQITCLPVGGDGNYRLAVGNGAGNFTDSLGFTWWGRLNGAHNYCDLNDNSSYYGTGWDFASACGTIYQAGQTWPSTGGTDYQLKAYSLVGPNDMKTQVVGLPNATYTVFLYGEPGFGTTHAGQNVFDVQGNGIVLGTLLDGYILAGNRQYHGYTQTYSVPVNNNVLDFNARVRALSAEGMSISSLEIVPGSSPPPINGHLFSR